MHLPQLWRCRDPDPHHCLLLCQPQHPSSSSLTSFLFSSWSAEASLFPHRQPVKNVSLSSAQSQLCACWAMLSGRLQHDRQNIPDSANTRLHHNPCAGCEGAPHHAVQRDIKTAQAFSALSTTLSGEFCKIRTLMWYTHDSHPCLAWSPSQPLPAARHSLDSRSCCWVAAPACCCPDSEQVRM